MPERRVGSGADSFALAFAEVGGGADVARRGGGPAGGEARRADGAGAAGAAPESRHGGARAADPMELAVRGVVAAALGAPMTEPPSRARLAGGSGARPFGARRVGDCSRLTPCVGTDPAPRAATFAATHFSKAPVGDRALLSCLKVSMTSRLRDGGSLASSSFARTGSKFHLATKSWMLLASGAEPAPPRCAKTDEGGGAVGCVGRGRLFKLSCRVLPTAAARGCRELERR